MFRWQPRLTALTVPTSPIGSDISPRSTPPPLARCRYRAIYVSFVSCVPPTRYLPLQPLFLPETSIVGTLRFDFTNRASFWSLEGLFRPMEVFPLDSARGPPAVMLPLTPPADK